MTLALVRAELVTVLLGIPGIGRVYEHIPVVTSAKRARDLFAVAAGQVSQLHVWMVDSADGTMERRLTNREVVRTHHLRILGRLALAAEGATGPVFDDLTELVCSTFRSLDTLNGVAELTGEMQVVDRQPLLYMNVLCHGCTLTQDIQERIQY